MRLLDVMSRPRRLESRERRVWAKGREVGSEELGRRV